jgi:hypothetical protein
VSSVINFKSYIFHLLPISNNIQLDAFSDGVKSKEELLERKTELFKDVILKQTHLTLLKREYTFQLLYNEDELCVFKIGAPRVINRTRKDFTTEKLEHWDEAYMVINFAPNIQRIFTSKDLAVFKKSRTMVNMLEKTIEKELVDKQLALNITELPNDVKFREKISKYNGKIKSIRFELSSPNMPSISNNLKLDLKEISKETGMQKSTFELHSNENAALNIDTAKGSITGSMIDYSLEGGGNITLSVDKVKSKIKSNDSTKEVSIDKIKLENLTEKQLPEAISFLKDIFK